MNEKQVAQDDDQQEELIAAEEITLKEEIDGVAVHDADEAMHLTSPKISEENKLQDVDDAIHKTISPVIVSEELGKEIDPDELVHGH